ncbi:restriction endonuclease [Salmonella enterica]|nr:restriction endonuclease [Salmonella enterica]
MNKNREYEVFTKRLYKTLTRMHPGAKVEHDVVIGGNQIDVSLTHSLAGIEYLTIVECKNYNAAVDLNCYRQLVHNMVELNARGVLVTTVGFQAGVIEKAKSRGDVTLLKVNFEIQKNAASLDVGFPNVVDVQYYFDEHTSTQRQFDILRKLYDNGQSGHLTVFRDCDDETITLDMLHHSLPIDVPDGVHKTQFDGTYVKLPAPFNESIRIVSATYTVKTVSISRGLGMVLTADIVTARVLNQLTGGEYELVIDDDF